MKVIAVLAWRLFDVTIRAAINVLLMCEFIHALYLFLWEPVTADLVLNLVSSTGRWCVSWIA